MSQPWANTTTRAGKLIMTVFAGIAEFERGLIRERTSADREAVRHSLRALESSTRADQTGFPPHRRGPVRREIADTFTSTPQLSIVSKDGGLSAFSVPLLPISEIQALLG
jgi:DNA invertase Pin-like site-specific DNA recombinase